MRGLSYDECIQIILFFSHQCNTTLCFIEAVQTLISDAELMDTMSKRKISFYRILGEICIHRRRETPPGVPIKDIETMKDVGCGSNPRYQPSNTTFLSEETVNEYVKYIADTCSSHSEKMSRCYKVADKLKLVVSFTESMKELTGIRDVKSQAICQLCALFGIIQLDFYTYIPMHNGGGREIFMSNLMNFQTSVGAKKKEREEEIIDWNINQVSEIQDLYNKEFTYNMFENLTCEIVRGNTAYDLFFKMYHLKVCDGKQIILDRNKRLQLFFRVNGRQSCNWVLEGFSGKSKFYLFAERHSSKAALLRWERASNGHIRKNVRLQIGKEGLALIQNIFK